MCYVNNIRTNSFRIIDTVRHTNGVGDTDMVGLSQAKVAGQVLCTITLLLHCDRALQTMVQCATQS